jgi:hypothetical protein
VDVCKRITSCAEPWQTENTEYNSALEKTKTRTEFGCHPNHFIACQILGAIKEISKMKYRLAE